VLKFYNKKKVLIGFVEITFESRNDVEWQLWLGLLLLLFFLKKNCNLKHFFIRNELIIMLSTPCSENCGDFIIWKL